MGFIDKPHQLWIRKAMFQVHLWLGLLLALYMVVLGISGSILVFREEFTNLATPKHLPPPEDALTPQLSAPVVLGLVKSHYPERKITWIQAPRPETPTFMTTTVVDKKRIAVYIHPATGKILGETVQEGELWLNWVSRLHIFLLSGHAGFIANGIGAILLVIVCMSGMVIWWPGIQHWSRAFVVDFRTSWKRINFDLHSAAGIWGLSFLLIWSLTTVYFVWPKEAKQFISLFAPFSKPGPPIGRAQARRITPPLDVPLILRKAQELSPQAKFSALLIPIDERGTLLVHMARGVVGDFGTSDILFFDPIDLRHLGTQRNGMPEALGDKITSLMVPLHFGNRWGFAMKVLWALVGMSLPVLAVTGSLMYWNRYLSKRLRQVRHSREPIRLAIDPR